LRRPKGGISMNMADVLILAFCETPDVATNGDSNDVAI
jgi:hypothetical protein